MNANNKPNKALLAIGITALVLFMAITGLGLFFSVDALPVAILIFIFFIVAILLIGFFLRKEKSRKWTYKQYEIKESLFRWLYFAVIVSCLPFFVHGMSMFSEWSEKASTTRKKVEIVEENYTNYVKEVSKKVKQFETKAKQLKNSYLHNYRNSRRVMDRENIIDLFTIVKDLSLIHI